MSPVDMKFTYRHHWSVYPRVGYGYKLKFHGTDTDTDTDSDTDTDILADLSADSTDTRAFPREDSREVVR